MFVRWVKEDQLLPGATTAAPWAKVGTIAVAANKPFLASESQNTYVSWYVNNTATNWPCAKAPTNSGALEGTLDLVSAFGYLPTNIYLCAAAYQTANGGALAAQCPAGSGPNINTNEFFVIPIAALRDSLGNGTFDRLDPARGFRILSAGATPAGLALNWASMPGYSYQVLYADYVAFLRAVIALRTFGIAEDALLRLWNFEKKLLQLLHVDSTGSPTWFLDSCGVTTHPNQRLLLTNHDLGVPVPSKELQLGLDFADKLPELFGGTEMGEDALRVLNEYITLYARIRADLRMELPHVREAAKRVGRLP